MSVLAQFTVLFLVCWCGPTETCAGCENDFADAHLPIQNATLKIATYTYTPAARTINCYNNRYAITSTTCKYYL